MSDDQSVLTEPNGSSEAAVPAAAEARGRHVLTREERGRRRLTPREQRFVAHYLETGVIAEAARQAGYSPATARNGGHRVLRRPRVAAAVEAGRRAIQERHEINLERAVERFETAWALAHETKNATAAASLVTTYARMGGLLIDNQRLQQQSLNINLVRYGDAGADDYPAE